MGLPLTWLAEFERAGLLPETAVAPLTTPPPHTESQMRVVTLPVPPSSNNLYHNLRSGGRRMTDEGRAWQAEAVKRLERMRKAVNYPVTIHWVIRSFLRASRDGANTEKILTDTLKLSGVIKDDSINYVVGQSWRYDPEPGGEGVDVWWEPANPVAKKPKAKRVKK